MSESSDVQRMVDHAIATFGRLDYAVNAAGIAGPLAETTELAEEDWDLVLDTNLRGAFPCLKHEAYAMRARGSSRRRCTGVCGRSSAMSPSTR